MMVAYTFNNVGSLFGATDRVHEFVAEPVKIAHKGGKTLPAEQAQGNLEFKNVKFRYPSKPDIQVLKGVSFEVNNRKNRVVALVGSSGCGKSSIVQLIERFYDPEEGEILFNGVNIRELDMHWYHNTIGIVQQEPILFSGTIKDNITYGLDLEGKSEEEVTGMMDEACKSANAYHFIHDKQLFPECYETIVGERGAKLSGG